MGNSQNTPAAKYLQALSDGMPFSKLLDGYTYIEALAILDSISAEIKSESLGGKGYMDTAEDKGTRIEFEKNRNNISYPYRKAGLDENGCRVIVYDASSIDDNKLEQFIEEKILFFEGLNESSKGEFVRQTLLTFNEKHLAEILEKHDKTFKRNTSDLREKLIQRYLQKGKW